ncbi:MAG: hypothetical protein IJ301_02440 [Clostridia bacterium]|nr:hypothetical protein [Clostridia bacterium]
MKKGKIKKKSLTKKLKEDIKLFESKSASDIFYLDKIKKEYEKRKEQEVEKFKVENVGYPSEVIQWKAEAILSKARHKAMRDVESNYYALWNVRGITCDGYKKQKEPETAYIPLAIAGSGILGFGLYEAVYNLLRKHQISQNTDEINAKVYEYSVAKAEELNEKYPVLDLTPNGLEGQIEKAFDSCYSGGHMDHVVKEGWNDFFVDYKNKVIDVEGDIDAIENSLINMDLVDGLSVGIGVGVGMTAAFALAVYPYIKWKAQEIAIKKYIDIVEEKYDAANSEMSDYITADNSKIDIITKEVAGNKMVKDIKYIPNENVR